MVFRFEVVKEPSPPLFIQCKLVTLLENAFEVNRIEFSQIVSDAPALTVGFFWIGIITVLDTGTPQGALGWAVIVSTIWLFNISWALGVTIGFNIEVFEIVVPVVELHTKLE